MEKIMMTKILSDLESELQEILNNVDDGSFQKEITNSMGNSVINDLSRELSA